jgi:hypothetical protein
MSLFLIEQSLTGAAAVTAKLAILASSGVAATLGGFLMTRFPGGAAYTLNSVLQLYKTLCINTSHETPISRLM